MIYVKVQVQFWKSIRIHNLEFRIPFPAKSFGSLRIRIHNNGRSVQSPLSRRHSSTWEECCYPRTWGSAAMTDAPAPTKQ
jgi:hypothetical protein